MREVRVGCLPWMLCVSVFAYGDRGWNLSLSMCAMALCQTLLLDLAANCVFQEKYSIHKVRNLAISAGAI